MMILKFYFSFILDIQENIVIDFNYIYYVLF